MDWRDTAEQAAWRNEVRGFVEAELPKEFRGVDSLGEDAFFRRPDSPLADAFDRWRDALAGRGWIASHWPKEYGGAGLSPIDQFILAQEFAEARAPQLGGSGVMMLGPTIITHGNKEQKQEHLPRILDGTAQWCQGYSEPGSGSDLASLQTRAVRDGDDFVVNGQKIWTSGAHLANWMFLLTRTDPDAPKHRGITYMLLDMRTPGITVRPLVNMGNQHGFNEVFFEDVRIPAANAVGETDRGWYVGATTLDFERSMIGQSTGQRQTVERYLGWLREHRADRPAIDYKAARRQWAERWIEVAVATQLSYRTISMQAAGEIPNSESSVAKLFNSELTQRIAGTAAKMLGMWGEVSDPDRAPLGAIAATSYISSVSSTIAGGTSEIQRGIVATRGLGLPRG
jgi:alkylation response protein AidB-like acyl-CoA dehydrogenase